MDKPNHVATIKGQQLAWAAQNRLTVDSAGYFGSPSLNLPWLNPETRAEFDEADGHEFGAEGQRSKIAALHSSSALAVNVFDYWRTRRAEPLARALGVDAVDLRIAFEQKFPTGVGTRAPNLDVVIRTDSRLLAIESKFTETFGAGKQADIQDKYFPDSGGLWSTHGLVGAQTAANGLRHHRPFAYLNTSQLLKHMLGLARSGESWQLLLLWFAPSAAVAREMEREAEEFRKLLGPDAPRFQAMTYQTLWQKLHPLLADEHQRYGEYVERRYLADVVA